MDKNSTPILHSYTVDPNSTSLEISAFIATTTWTRPCHIWVPYTHVYVPVSILGLKPGCTATAGITQNEEEDILAKVTKMQTITQHAISPQD